MDWKYCWIIHLKRKLEQVGFHWYHPRKVFRHHPCTHRNTEKHVNNLCILYTCLSSVINSGLFALPFSKSNITWSKSEIRWHPAKNPCNLKNKNNERKGQLFPIGSPYGILGGITPVGKWSITMVSKSLKRGCSPSKWPKWLVNGSY